MLAVIGGTGLYQLEKMEVIGEHEIETPFGKPSSNIVQGRIKKNDSNTSVLFLARHGTSHSLLPHEVNYRANIWALKKVGATRVIGISAVGSLQPEIKPGDISIPEQYFDFVKGHREKTFFGNGVAAHVSTAQPTCSILADRLEKAGANIDIKIHRHRTYACVDGPRLGTKAESNFLRGPAGSDLVGMTNVPEVFLACEAQLPYCTIAIATDYDCWQEDPSLHVSVEQVISRYGGSLEKAKSLLLEYILTQDAEVESDTRHSLKTALLTPLEALNEQQKMWLDILFK